MPGRYRGSVLQAVRVKANGAVYLENREGAAKGICKRAAMRRENGMRTVAQWQAAGMYSENPENRAGG